MSDPVYLPDVTTTAWAIHSHRTPGTEGESQAIVLMTLEFQAAPGHVARQTFILHKDDAKQIRADLKNPPAIQIPEEISE